MPTNDLTPPAITPPGKRCLVAANFTADPIKPSLGYFIRTMALPVEIELAAYDQVMQVLFSLQSSESGAPDFLVVLLQLERWIGDGESAEFERKIEDFCAAVATASSATQVIVLLCPVSPGQLTNRALLRAEASMAAWFEPLPAVDFIGSRELEDRYPVEGIEPQFDAYANKLAQVPFTRACFARLGTMVARRLYGRLAPAKKVIVVDCDHTLWSGVVGEEGAMGVGLAPVHHVFQDYLIQQGAQGRLVCLCSKNNAADVFQVFSENPAMRLKVEHLAAWKVNWTAKPENLRALSAELSLGTDSFVFIDDDNFECNLMRALCPEVLTVQVPKNRDELVPLLRGLWELDERKATGFDRNRTAYYRQNSERARVREQTGSLEEFIASLQLELRVDALSTADLARAAQLTERTNQFNLNGRRWTTGELAGLMGSARFTCEVLRASDRFGDYGEIGVLVCRIEADAVRVETLVLSCRALGKGIETRVVERLEQIAAAHAGLQVEFAFRETPKNHATRAFLEQAAECGPDGLWRLRRRRLGLADQAKNIPAASATLS